MRSHYEVLNLEKNCSAKDIKESYIKLSKKYHPDKNKSPEAHKKFVEVNEAYSVLGKSCSRLRYDEILSQPPRQTGVVYPRSAGARMRTHEFYNPNAFAQNYKHNYEKSGGWNTPLKYKMLLYCCLLITIGTGVRVMVIWHDIKRKEAQSKELSLILKEVKERGHRLGKEEAIIEMQKAFLKNNKSETRKRPDQ